MRGARLTVRRLVLRGAVLLLVAGYIGLSTVLALDRAASADPALGRWVPAPFRHEALASEGQALLRASQPAQLLPLATALVRRDPLHPHAAGLLGLARLAQGDARGADAAFRIAARLGWRDPVTQVYWLQSALTAGDWPRATTRFTAIARQWPAAPAIDQLSAQFEADPRGQMLLARQVADGSNWVDAYAHPQPGQSPERIARRATVLIAAAGLGQRVGCPAIAPMVNALVPDQPALASRLWAAQCPRAAQPGLISDGGFSQAATAAGQTPFDWRFPGNGAIQADIAPGPSGSRALQAASSAATLTPLAMQRIVLPGGRYLVSWAESGIAPGRPSRLAASLSCRTERELANPQYGQGKAGRGVAALIFAGGCTAPTLQLWITPGTAPVSIDDVALDRR